MIKSIVLRNFRCFSSLRIADLRTVNVVVGPNGSGKTALLESLVLGLRAHPNAAQILNQSRGVPAPGVNMPGVSVFFGTPEQFTKATWDHYFYKGDTANQVTMEFDELSATGVRAKYNFRLYYGKLTPGATLPSSPNVGVFAPALPPLIFERSTNRRAAETISVVLDSKSSLQITGPSSYYFDRLLYFDQSSKFSETENVGWFSQLKIDRPEAVRNIESVLAEGFPGISDLDILSPVGSQAIWASMKDGTKRPLALISAGLHKVVTLLIAISWVKDGVVIVDEIENGVFYEKYPLMWRSLIKICKENRNQLFVSSHSLECLRALPRSPEAAEDYCVLRARLGADQSVTFDQFTGELVEDAIAGAVEIRGSSKVN